jgi:abortive infection Abi-like protein
VELHQVAEPGPAELRIPPGVPARAIRAPPLSLGAVRTTPFDELVAGDAAELTAESIEAAWRKALERRASDPEGAITAARTLLESTCKTILDDRDRAYSDKDDLPALYREVAKTLRIAPSDHTEEQFRAILGACTTVVRELGSLRNRISDSHGPGRRRYRPGPRHAALAVNLAGSMALFLMQTHEARSDAES